MTDAQKLPMTVAELRRALSTANSTALVFVLLSEDGYRLAHPETNDEVGHPFDAEVVDDAPVVYLRPCRHASRIPRRDR